MFDVGAGGLRDPQPVQREQGDQGMLRRQAEPGGDQERAELVAVQGDRVRLIVQPRAADVGSRGPLEELFLDRVLVEPGDGRQPPGDGRAGPAAGFEVPGEALDIGAADGEQRQAAEAAPGRELAQVQGVGLRGQASVPGQEPGEGEPFRIGEGGLDRGERGGRSGSGHRAPPGRAGTGRAGPVPIPAVKRKPNVNRPARSRYATDRPAPVARRAYKKCSRPPITRVGEAMQLVHAAAHRSTFISVTIAATGA